MTQSSFYGDTPNYATTYPTQNDSNSQPVSGNTQAPSSFYPNGGAYLAADPIAAAAGATAAAASAATAASSATAAAASAATAASSATAAATSATNAASAVQAVAGTATPIIDGTATVGVSTKWAHEDHIHPTDTTRAPLASPALTGTPTAPTATVGTNTTQLATTAFVLANSAGGTPASATPLVDSGAGAVGVGTKYAREDHVHPTDATRAPLASPTLTGVPAAPTAAVSTNTTQLATTAFVVGQLATVAPLIDGTAAVGTSLLTARQDHVHPTDTTRAQYEALASNNILLNGGMEVSQENGANSITVSSSYVMDGWIALKTGTMVLTAQQVADAPTGFTNSLKVTVGTAEASIAAGDYAVIYQPVEGFRSSRLSFGTAAAQSVTLGFWTKIHRTGTYSGSLKNAANTRTYPFTFTQNVADTWEYKTVTIPGDTAGTWVGNTNASALIALFAIACGATFTGTAGAWAAVNYNGATGTTNGVAATSDVFQITGVSLLPGSVAPSSSLSQNLKRPYGEELVVCKRYFQKIGGDVAYDGLLIQGNAVASGAVAIMVPYPTEMRAIPTITFTGTWTFANCGTLVTYIGSRGAYFSLVATAAGAAYYWNAAGSYIKLDARL